jgi:haloacetate dehalogenase
VLWGRSYLAGDVPSPLAAWRDWADDVSEIAVDCGHFIAEEPPAACAEALADFFDARGHRAAVRRQDG